jgi:NADH-quinone oxidoreductase subunit J
LGGISNLLPEISEEMLFAGTVEALGDALYTEYLFVFEMTAILLTAAVVGAIMVAQYKVKRKEEIKK